MVRWGKKEAGAAAAAVVEAVVATSGEKEGFIWGPFWGLGGLGLGFDWVGTGRGHRVGGESIMKWLTPEALCPSESKRSGNARARRVDRGDVGY